MLSFGMFGRSIARVMQFNMMKTSTTLSNDVHAIRRQQSRLSLYTSNVHVARFNNSQVVLNALFNAQLPVYLRLTTPNSISLLLATCEILELQAFSQSV